MDERIRVGYIHSPAKISIIGIGYVGATIAYTLMFGGDVSELMLIDIDKKRAEGEGMDMNHGMSFLKPMKVEASDEIRDVKGSNIIVIAAGAAQRGPDESRLDLVRKNAEIFKELIPQIYSHAPEAILLVVSNPVDVLTYLAIKCSDYNANRVIGSGTILDSARFRYLLSEHCKIDARNMHGYIIGEHGDSSVPVWSLTNVAGMNFDRYCSEYCSICKKGCETDPKEVIYDRVREAAYEIIQRKGATNFAIAVAVRRIIEAIMRDERSVFTVSTLMKGQYGVKDIALSLPAIISAEGILRVLDLPLTVEEENAFNQSAQILKKICDDIGI